MACDLPEPCKFPPLDSYKKRFLWTHKDVDLAPHPVVGLVFQVGDTEKFSHALGFESLAPNSFIKKSKAKKKEKTLALNTLEHIPSRRSDSKTTRAKPSSSPTFPYPLTGRVLGASQMISQPVSSIFLCSPLPSGAWQTPGLSIP